MTVAGVARAQRSGERWSATRTVLAAGWLVGVCAVLASAQPPVRPADPLTPGEARQVRAWLYCIECATERDSLLAVAARKPATVDSLTSALQLGPPIAPRDLEREFDAAFTRDSLYRTQRGLQPSPWTRPRYVAENVRRYVEGYRSRAAAGLGIIGTPEARAVLASAIATRQLPQSVHDAAVAALGPPP